MTFNDAAACFLAARQAPVPNSSARYVSDRTYRDLENYLKRLAVYFGPLRLQDIHLGDLTEYQRRRLAGDGFTRIVGNRKDGVPVPSPAGPNKVEDELKVLIRVLRRARLWDHDMKDFHVRLQRVEKDIPRALTPDQQEHFFAVANSTRKWQIVLWYAAVALYTTFSSDEMRTLRLADINLTPHVMTISVNYLYGKNRYRRRTVPIVNAMCAWALERLLELARSRGAHEPHHYLFPFRASRNNFDPLRPMSATGIRKQHEAVRAAAGVPWFNLNGWRHTGITRLAEDGMPYPMIQAMTGHNTRRMTEHYTHVAEQALRLRLGQVGQHDYYPPRKPPMPTSPPPQPFSHAPWQSMG
jgi:integrase